MQFLQKIKIIFFNEKEIFQNNKMIVQELSKQQNGVYNGKKADKSRTFKTTTGVVFRTIK